MINSLNSTLKPPDSLKKPNNLPINVQTLNLSETSLDDETSGRTKKGGVGAGDTENAEFTT